MQFCVTRVILRDLAALVPQIFHSFHKITHFLTGYINSYFFFQKVIQGQMIVNIIFSNSLVFFFVPILKEIIFLNLTVCRMLECA
jgi:hypothetical protein